ncbi:MAG TPA: hypothetical protein VNZ86_19060 [Bacteroidia bacterium]|nr:hypothetical protein [Bacteroidia bacterium]
MKYKLLSLFLILCLAELPFRSLAQVEGNESGSSRKGKGFHFGLGIGSFFANKYNASLYDGYGLDINGNKNDFDNSAMNRKINYEYGGGNGLPDRISPALNLNRSDWSFDQTDMPLSIKYNPAIEIGLDMRYGITSKDIIICNINAAQLTASGQFTITTNVYIPGNQYQQSILYFPIIGGEQRLMTQLGYQRIMGDNDMFNFFMEGGMVCTMSKFTKNQIQINGLNIDLTTYYDNYGYVAYRANNITGIGFGAFAGMGINLTLGKKWIMQLVYDPSMEKVNMGPDPKYTFQNTLGLRAYYNLKPKL